MVETYGCARGDAMLVLDVASENEGGVPQEKIFVNTRSTAHQIFVVLLISSSLVPKPIYCFII
jgi:hypothetical protein